jgi:hypothetical protein
MLPSGWKFSPHNLEYDRAMILDTWVFDNSLLFNVAGKSLQESATLADRLWLSIQKAAIIGEGLKHTFFNICLL